jgi:hypothetical protein
LHATYLALHLWLDYTNYTFGRVKIMKFLVMQFSLNILSLRFSSVEIFSSAFSSQTPVVYIPPLLPETQVSHPHKITGKVIVLCTLIFTFYIRRDDKFLNLMVANISQIQTPRKFLLNHILNSKLTFTLLTVPA